MKVCKFCGSKNVEKYKDKKLKNEVKEIYKCKDCGKTFSFDDEKIIEKILNSLDHKGKTLKQLKDEIKIHHTKIRNCLDKLIEEGKISKVNIDGTVYYAVGNAKEIEENKKNEKEHYDDAIILSKLVEYLKNKKYATIKDIATDFNMNNALAKRLVLLMLDNGIVSIKNRFLFKKCFVLKM